jgi:hypothetical protein
MKSSPAEIAEPEPAGLKVEDIHMDIQPRVHEIDSAALVRRGAMRDARVAG